jgi:hypothetical protein
MITHRQLKLDLLKEQNDFLQVTRAIITGILPLDPNAALCPVEKAIASRSLVKKFWDMLPGEEDCYSFTDIEEQSSTGKSLLLQPDFSQVVTLHLGWDLLCFSCTFEAAWDSWASFNTLNTDTFNACIYPSNLEWFVIRAGNNLYPMQFAGERYEIIRRDIS